MSEAVQRYWEFAFHNIFLSCVWYLKSPIEMRNYDTEASQILEKFYLLSCYDGLRLGGCQVPTKAPLTPIFIWARHKK